jgi:hypothetical protein
VDQQLVPTKVLVWARYFAVAVYARALGHCRQQSTDWRSSSEGSEIFVTAGGHDADFGI